MKKFCKRSKTGLKLFWVLVLLVFNFLPVGELKAASGRDISNHITSLTTDAQDLRDGSRITVTAKFDDQQGTIKAGDYMHVSWPSQTNQAWITGFSGSKDLFINGIKVGVYTVDESGATVTFNEQVEKVKKVFGQFEFTVSARNTSQNRQTIYITAGSQRTAVEIAGISGYRPTDIDRTGKGWSSYKQGNFLTWHGENYICWQLFLNRNASKLKGPIQISDQMPEGTKLDQASVNILYGRGYNQRVSASKIKSVFPNSSVDINGNTINAVFSEKDFNGRNFQITYNTYPEDPSKAEFTNTAKISYELDEADSQVTSQEDSAQVKNISFDADVYGTRPHELKIIKSYIDENSTKKPLEDAEFEIRKQGSNGVNTYTTNEQGIIDLTDLDAVKDKIWKVNVTDNQNGQALQITNDIKKQKKQPLTPLTPSKKVIPWTPLTPSTKVIPWTPLTPSTKVIPWTPLTPAKKVIPWTPLTPAKKVIPWTPLTPATKVIPWTPLTPATKVIPWTPLTPSTKVIPWTPLTPSMQVIPWTPLTPSTKVIPWTPLTPAKQVIPWTPLTPSTKEIPWTPLTPAKQVIPWTQLTPSTKVIPWTPLTPSKKVIPWTPLTPSTKEIPWTPLTPSTKVIPWTPLTPATKVIPWTPLTPAKKVIPWTPLTPATKVIPWTPLTPSKKVIPWTPLTPSTKVIPWTPLTPSTKVIPWTPLTPSTKVIPWTPLTPATSISIKAGKPMTQAPMFKPKSKKRTIRETRVPKSRNIYTGRHSSLKETSNRSKRKQELLPQTGQQNGIFLGCLGFIMLLVAVSCLRRKVKFD